MIKPIRPSVRAIGRKEWRDLSDVEVELTSEHPDFPIEGALLGDGSHAWRADAHGPQTIRLSWPTPIAIHRVSLVFEEHRQARTQEFVLRANTRDGAREIVRQQFTFSPPGTTVEREEYSADVDGVSSLELAITPAIDGIAAFATLREWRVA